MLRRFRFVGSCLLLGAVFCATAATAQISDEMCQRNEDRFFGELFPIRYAVLLDPKASEPNLFPNTSIRSDPGQGCIADGLTGNINCVGQDMSAGEGVPLDGAGVNEAAGNADGEVGTPRMVTLTLLLRPVFVPGNPSSISLEEVGAPDVTRPADLSESEADQATKALRAQLATIAGWRQNITLADMDPILDGDRPVLSLPVANDRVQQRGLPPELWLAKGCGSLFADLANRAILEDKRAAVVDELADLRQRLQAEVANSGWAGYFYDSSYVNQLQKRIGYLERQKAALDKLIGEKNQNIARRTKVLSEEDRAREMAAIKADPKRLATEEARRRDEMIAAARETARYQMRLLEGEKVYARQLAAMDAMIGEADARGADALGDRLRSDRDRLATARDQWRHSANGMYGVRLADEARLKAQNSKDGIGPTNHASQMLRAEGKDAKEVLFAGAREEARAVVTRQAMYDAASLGGSATQTYTAEDFARDLGESNAEYANDPMLFLKRYNAYVEGVEQVVIDEVTDIVATGTAAADIAGEVFESTLEDATGIKSDVFGDDKLQTGAAAATTLSNLSANDVGDAVDRAAQSFNDQVDSASRRGEEGLQDSLGATGYVAGSILLPDTKISDFVKGGRVPSKTRSTSRAPDVGPPTKPARPSRERVVLTAPPGTAAPKTAPTVPEEFNVLAGPGTPTRTTPSTKRIPPGDAAPAVRAETISDGSRALPPRQPVTLTAPEPARPTNPTPAKAPREPVTLTAPKTNPPTATPATKAPRERVTLTAPEPRATTPAVPEPRSTNPATPERPPRETVTLTEPNNSGPTSRSTPPSQQPTSPPVSEISEPAKRAGPRAPSRAKYAVGGLLTLGSQTSMVDAPGAGSFVRGINNNSNVREVLFIDKVRPRGAGAGDDPIVRKLQNMGFTVGDEAVPVQLPSQPPQRLGPRVDLTLPSDGGSTTRRLPDGRVQDR